MAPSTTAQHSKNFKAAFSQFLKNRRAKKPSRTTELKARGRMQVEIQYLDQNAIQAGNSRDDVRKLLGEPYGEWGADSWLYPGPERDHFYRIDFDHDRVSNKYFAKIYDAESGK